MSSPDGGESPLGPQMCIEQRTFGYRGRAPEVSVLLRLLFSTICHRDKDGSLDGSNQRFHLLLGRSWRFHCSHKAGKAGSMPASSTIQLGITNKSYGAFSMYW